MLPVFPTIVYFFVGHLRRRRPSVGHIFKELRGKRQACGMRKTGSQNNTGFHWSFYNTEAVPAGSTDKFADLAFGISDVDGGATSIAANSERASRYRKEKRMDLKDLNWCSVSTVVKFGSR